MSALPESSIARPASSVLEVEMFKVFNMGIGYTFVVRPSFAHAVVRHLAKLGERAYIIGQVKRGKGTVEIR